MLVRRILATVILGAALAVLFIAPAHGFTVTGGNSQQQADVYATINAMQFPSVDWVESKVGSVHIEILDSYPPYWLQTLDSTDDFRVDVFSAAAAGVAWPGNIRIHSYYTPGERTFFREIVSHEFSHQVWFALLYVPGATTEWRSRVEAGLTPDSSDWFHNYVESHAEQLRVAAWTSDYYSTLGPRTYLNILGDDAVREFHERWVNGTTTTTAPVTTTTSSPTTTTTTAPPTTSTTIPPSTTTTTTGRGNPFTDIDRSDMELWDAAWLIRDLGLIYGYGDGSFGPWNLLTHRQAELIIIRWIGTEPTDWMNDYSPVTRGELNDRFYDLAWDSERWDEYLLRSQLLRLMWRSGE